MAKPRVPRIDNPLGRAALTPASLLQSSLQQAAALHQVGQLPQAEAAYAAILAQAPAHPEALHLMGVLQCQRGNHERGVQFIGQAVALNGRCAQWHYNLGLALQHLKRFENALASFDRALQLERRYVEALNNRGVVLLELKRHQDALASFDHALKVNPTFVEALVNRGTALNALQRYEDALSSLNKALRLDPKSLHALNNRGRILQELNRPADALVDFDCALAIRSDTAEAHWNRGLCRLITGELGPNAWADFEWRWRLEEHKDAFRQFEQPFWDGQHSLVNKSILLHAEQGLGDTIQFCRYAKRVSDLGASVFLEVQPALKPLLSSLEGVKQVFARGESLPTFDYQCPLLSLPLALGTTLETIPADIPYIRADPFRIEQWRAQLGARRSPRVGIAWCGSHTHVNDARRSIPFYRFSQLLQGHVDFVSIQKAARPEDLRALKVRKNVLHVGDELQDFADTAAIIHLMDVVLAVDTSVVHLAGAMGKPVWVLLPFAPDWRWLLERHSTPWYPTARLFRQPAPGAWGDLLDYVAKELLNLPGRNAGPL